MSRGTRYSNMASTDIIVSLLMRTDLFGGLDAVQIAACAAVFRQVQFSKGETLFARGEVGSRLYLIAEGRVRLAVMTDEGRELSFRHATVGHLVGEIAALDGEPRSADALALSHVIAYSVERNALTELCVAHPAILSALVRFLCRRVRDTSTQLEAIALYPIEARLARFLLVALGKRTSESGKRIPLDLGFSQSELAQLLGASRPKVNAALGLLEEMNAIKRTLDRVFCDPDKLTEIAQGDDV
jgi:CRP/FNR family transcriptional regulator, cyclic AMP receptor protein